MTIYQTPDYLTIGHVAKDKIPGGAILGGTCGYSAVTAHRLGQQTAALTSYGPDIPSLAAFDGIAVKNIPCAESTRFENIYENGKRRQKWLATSSMLTFEHVPAAWREAPIVHLAPLTQEMSPSLCGDFPNSLVCVTAQGWLRGQNEAWEVIYRPHAALEAWLPQIEVMVLSLADLFGNEAAAAHLLTSVKLGVQTIGPRGCKLYHQGEMIHVPVEPEEELDPTGAGDIFATAFFIRYHETGNPVKAAQFANACASLSVRKQGMASSPTLAETEARMIELYGA